MDDYALYDEKTKKWLKEHPYATTTIDYCERCGLGYRFGFDHKCKNDEVEKVYRNDQRRS